MKHKTDKFFHLPSHKDFRIETKFIISDDDIRKVIGLVKSNPAVFRETYPQRRVNSLYLDSVDLDNYHNHVMGISQRYKVRIRWYGQLFGLIEKPILELKVKTSNLGKKFFFPLKPFLFDTDFSLNKINQIFKDSNLPRWLNENLRVLCFSVLCSYDRKYFVSLDKKIRITLDNYLTFLRVRNNRNSFGEKVTDKQKIILEVKYPLRYSDEASKITNSFPFKAMAYSKYLFGVNLLNR